MKNEIQSRIEIISKINTAIYLGNDENYHKAVQCIHQLMECRYQIAKRCRDFNMPDESRDLYYELFEQYNENIRKVLGL